MRRPEVTARPKPPSTEPLTDVPTTSPTDERPRRRRARRRAIEPPSSSGTRGSTCVRTETSGDHTRDVCFVR